MLGGNFVYLTRERLIEIEKELVADDVSEWLYSNEFLSLLQDGEDMENHFVWIHSLNILEPQTSTLPFDDHFFTEIKEIIQEMTEIDEPLQPLYHHPRAKKFIEPLMEKEQKEILQEAERVLMKYLRHE